MFEDKIARLRFWWMVNKRYRRLSNMCKAMHKTVVWSSYPNAYTVEHRVRISDCGAININGIWFHTFTGLYFNLRESAGAYKWLGFIEPEVETAYHQWLKQQAAENEMIRAALAMHDRDESEELLRAVNGSEQKTSTI